MNREYSAGRPDEWPASMATAIAAPGHHEILLEIDHVRPSPAQCGV